MAAGDTTGDDGMASKLNGSCKLSSKSMKGSDWQSGREEAIIRALYCKAASRSFAAKSGLFALKLETVGCEDGDGR